MIRHTRINSRNIHTAPARALCFALCVVFMLLMLPAAAYSAETETVRVGFFAFDGYHVQDENGVLSGYGYEILQHIAGYAGLRYEYVGYDKSWAEMQKMLADGEIDLLTSAQKTPEREQSFDFTDADIGSSSAILTVKNGETRYLLDDYQGWNGIRVGMLRENSRNDDLAEYAEKLGFSYETVYFDSTDEMLVELKSEKAAKSIDAVLTSNLRRVENETILAQFNTSPFYIMVRKGDTSLLERLNNAITAMDYEEQGLRTDLMRKYYAQTDGSDVVFSLEEQAYIQSMQGKTLKAILHSDRAPYSFYEDGKTDGILFAAAQLMLKRCGLNAEFLPAADSEEYYRLLDSGEADICFDAPHDYRQAEADNYWLFIPYTRLPVARLHRETVYEYKTAAVVKGSKIPVENADTIARLELDIVEYDSVEAVVAAVMKREVDMALLPVATARRAAWDEPTSSLSVEEMTGLYTELSIAVSKSTDSVLFSILSKASLSISGEDIDAITQQYEIFENKPIDFIGYCVNHPLHAILSFTAVFIIIMLAIGVYHLIRRKKKDEERLLEEHRQAEALTNALNVAESASKAKNRFLSSMSHEMRTPLNAIIGFLTLAKNADPDRMEMYRANSETAAKHLVSVINDVLDMSAIESGKLRLTQDAFDLRQLIYSVTNMYVAQCQSKNISFDTKLLTPIDEWLIGDQLRLNQVLMNLLSNAVKFTNRGKIQLLISETHSQNGVVFMRFVVTDTGCGMSEDMQKRLFKPFEQEDSTTARKYGGSGLGLSIVYNLVVMMGGAIKVTSKQGQGTSFTVDLPFEKCKSRSALPELNDVDKLRVLAVDDDETEREYISVVLKRMGVDFTCVDDGNAAIDELRREKDGSRQYNICLIDWKMPHLDGAETTRLIRKEFGSDVIVIVASAYDHARVDVKAHEAGANLFIPKPLFQSSLFDLFMTMTGGRVTKEKASVTDYSFTDKRVLLVEDNEMNRVIAEAILIKMGIDCETAIDGQIAFNKFMASEAGYYDAILMDVQMPNVDGLEATRMIRASAHSDADTVQIIALTANAFNEDITQTLSAGMNAHVSKPIEIKELAEALKRAFDIRFTENNQVSIKEQETDYAKKDTNR